MHGAVHGLDGRHARALFLNFCVMADFDYKSLIGEIKRYLSLECNYAKLTAVEKLSILLSAVAVSLVALIIGACAIFNLSSAIVLWLGSLLGCEWAAYLIMAVILLVVMWIFIACRKSLVVNPVTKFVTKLFLNPDEDEKD